MRLALRVTMLATQQNRETLDRVPTATTGLADEGSRVRPLGAFPVMLVAACGWGADGQRSAVAVSDSAGVRIVDNGSFDSGVALVVGEPVYRLGDEEEEYQFVSIAGGALRPDGTAVVADRGTNEVIVVNSVGGIAWAAGGQGEGPGEFSGLSSVGWQGDTVVAHDAGLRRVTYLVDGESLDSDLLPDPLSFVRAEWIGDGRMVVSPGGYGPISDDPWITMALVGHDLGSPRADTLLVYEFAQGIPSMDAIANPFRAFGTVAVRGSRIAYGRGDHAEIRITAADGTLEQIWRWEHPRASVTAEMWTAYAARRMESPGRRSDSEMRQYLAQLREAAQDPLPAFSAFHLDAAGRVWVRDFDPSTTIPTTFELFGGDGRWLGEVELPARTEILDAGEKFILAVERDEFEVQSVVLLPLRPAS